MVKVISFVLLCCLTGLCQPWAEFIQLCSGGNGSCAHFYCQRAASISPEFPQPTVDNDNDPTGTTEEPKRPCQWNCQDPHKRQIAELPVSKKPEEKDSKPKEIPGVRGCHFKFTFSPTLKDQLREKDDDADSPETINVAQTNDPSAEPETTVEPVGNPYRRVVFGGRGAYQMFNCYSKDQCQTKCETYDDPSHIPEWKPLKQPFKYLFKCPDSTLSIRNHIGSNTDSAASSLQWPLLTTISLTLAAVWFSQVLSD